MAELRSIGGLVEPAAEVDADLDSHAFFEMSSASAEQVTLQIRSLMERAWEYIAIAYQGRAHLALGYASWDEYVDDRLGDLRLTVPREQRGAVVQSLSRAQMSLRAIAKVLGVSVATAFRDVSADGSEHEQVEKGVPITVQGRDGRQYRKRRKTATTACTICGEAHEGAPGECPWDLFAQGRGPRPSPVPDSLDGRAGSQQSTDAEPEASASLNLVGTPSIVEALTRAVCIVDELDVLPELVDEIEIAGGSHDVMRAEAGLAASIRELIDHLRLQSEAMARLVRRLERVART